MVGGGIRTSAPKAQTGLFFRCLPILILQDHGLTVVSAGPGFCEFLSISPPGSPQNLPYLQKPEFAYWELDSTDIIPVVSNELASVIRHRFP